MCLLRYEHIPYLCLPLVVDVSDRLLWDEDTYPPDLQLLSSSDRPNANYKLFTIRDFLAHVELGPSAKRYIQIILARSFLPLLEGPWVGQSLTSQDVFVLCALEDGGTFPLFDKLFVSTHFKLSSGSGQKKPLRASHPIPVIRALGILLAEIELGDKLEEVYRNQRLDGELPQKVGDILRKEGKNRETLPTGALRAIHFCIEPKSFWDHRKPLKTNAPQHDQGFAKHYYTNIIMPLEEDIMKGSKWSLEEARCQSQGPLEGGIVRVIRKATFEPNEPIQAIEEGYRRLPSLVPIAEESFYSSHIPHLVLPSTLPNPRSLSDAQICGAGGEKLVWSRSIDSSTLANTIKAAADRRLVSKTVSVPQCS